MIQILKDSKNRVIQDIRILPPTEWRAWYLPQLRSRLENRMADLNSQVINSLNSAQGEMFDFAIDKADELIANAGIEAIPSAMIDPGVLSATKTLSGELVSTVPQKLRQKLGNRLSLGLMQEKSINEVVADMLEDFELSYAEAERIARTELLRTQSIAQEKRFRQVVDLQPTLRKRWVWSHKPDGRLGHAEAEITYTEEPIPFNDPFMVSPDGAKSKEALQFPRDPAGSPENTINCGCIHLLVPEGE